MMSSTGIESILSRAISDPAFAEQLLANPDEALAGYNLSRDEIAQIKGMSWAEFAVVAPEERKSFGIIVEYALTRQHNETALSVISSDRQGA